MTLSLPSNTTPSGNVKMSSVSSKLYVSLNHGSVLQIFKKNILPKRCTQENTVSPDTGSKSFKRKCRQCSFISPFIYVILVTCSSIDRKIHTFLIPSSQKWPLQRTVFSQLQNWMVKLICNEIPPNPTIHNHTHKESFHLRSGVLKGYWWSCD